MTSCADRSLAASDVAFVVVADEAECCGPDLDRVERVPLIVVLRILGNGDNGAAESCSLVVEVVRVDRQLDLVFGPRVLFEMGAGVGGGSDGFDADISCLRVETGDFTSGTEGESDGRALEARLPGLRTAVDCSFKWAFPFLTRLSVTSVCLVDLRFCGEGLEVDVACTTGCSLLLDGSQPFSGEDGWVGS